MLVNDFLDGDPITISLGEKVKEAESIMEENNFKILFVVDEDDVLEGFLTFSAIKDAEKERKVDDFMARSTLFAKADQPIDKAVSMMREHNLMVLPVVDSEKRFLNVLTPGKMFEEFSDLLNFGTGGFWITLHCDGEGELPSIIKTFLDEGAKLENVLVKNESEELQVIVKAKGIENKSSLKKRLLGAIND